MRRFGRLETLQPAYHMFRREIEDEILPYTAKNDIGVLVYRPRRRPFDHAVDRTSEVPPS